MRIFILTFFLFSIGCSYKQELQNIENIKLSENLAKELVSLSIKCVDKKYPYKIGYRFVDEDWLKPHYEITPSF